MVPDPVHTDGVQRWHDWLTVQLSPHEVLRESTRTPAQKGITWRVHFSDGGMGRVHAGAEAVVLGPDEFAKATSRIIEHGMLEELQAAEAGILLIGDADRMEVLV